MTIAKGYLDKDNLMDCSQNVPSSVISEHSLVKDVVSFTEELRMSYQPDSPVQPSPLQGSEKVKKTNGTCGLKLSNVYAEYDPDMRFWKMCQGCLQFGEKGGVDTSGKYLQTYTKHGMIANGVLSELTMLGLPIEERDCGSWLTPSTAQISGSDDRVQKRTEYRNSIGRKYVPGSLAEQIMWRTPSMNEPGVSPERLEPIEGGELGGMNRHFDKHTGRIAQIGLTQQVALRKSYPTPRTCMTGDVTSNRTTDKFNNLESVLAREMWPTPTSAEADKIPNKANYGQIGLSNHPRIRGLPDRKKATKSRSGEKMNYPTPQASMMTESDMEQARFAGTDPNRPEYNKAGSGSLNPDWVEWLMGWVVKWTSLEPMAEMLWLDWSVDPADMDTLPPRNNVKFRKWNNDRDGRKNRQVLSNLREAIHDDYYPRSNTGPIPRIATGIKDRVNRLKAIGNGQVPQTVATAFRLLKP